MFETGIAFLRQNLIILIIPVNSDNDCEYSRGLVGKVLDYRLKDCEFKSHSGHGCFETAVYTLYVFYALVLEYHRISH